MFQALGVISEGHFFVACIEATPRLMAKLSDRYRRKSRDRFCPRRALHKSQADSQRGFLFSILIELFHHDLP